MKANVKAAAKREVICAQPGCGSVINSHLRHCPVCEADAGFPNVRKCDTEDEKQALEKRYSASRADAISRGCEANFDSFETSASKSVAVICKDVSTCKRVLESDNQFYINFYGARDSGERSPEENLWDQTREAGDAMIFPNYHREILFAALSLDGQGVAGYGNTCMVLKDISINRRASVFESNSFDFVKAHKLSAGTIVPPGYRATWADRSKLAVTKVANSLTSTTSEDEFPDILLPKDSGRSGEFVEVHVYGKVHRKAVEKVIVNVKSMRGADKTIARALISTLKKSGVTVEEAM